MIDKAIIRKEQIAYLDQIKLRTGLDLSGIAKASNLASTTLTRFYNNKNFKFCLSSTTMSAIRAKFPPDIREPGISGANDNRADTELAISFVFQLLLKAVLNKKAIDKTWIEENFILAQNHYRKNRLPNAALLIGDLLASLSPEAHQTKQGPSRQPLGLVPLSLR